VDRNKNLIRTGRRERLKEKVQKQGTDKNRKAGYESRVQLISIKS